MAGKTKKEKRFRTKYRIRKRLEGTNDRPRVSIFRSSKHIYAQVISDQEGRTLVSASTLEQEVLDTVKSLSEAQGSKSTKSINAARAVGIVLAKRSIAKNIETVVFDRNGFGYTGRVKALGDGVREGGLKV